MLVLAHNSLVFMVQVKGNLEGKEVQVIDARGKARYKLIRIHLVQFHT